VWFVYVSLCYLFKIQCIYNVCNYTLVKLLVTARLLQVSNEHCPVIFLPCVRIVWFSMHCWTFDFPRFWLFHCFWQKMWCCLCRYNQELIIVSIIFLSVQFSSLVCQGTGVNGVTGLVVDHEESIFTGTAFCPLQCFDTDWFITSPTMKTHAWGGGVLT